MPIANYALPTIEARLRVEECDSEVVFLKLMVDKLTLQLMRAHRAQYGRSSEQLDHPQIALIEAAPLYEHPAPKAAPRAEAANSPAIDRQLPAHLPHEDHLHRAAAADAALDATGNACGCTACGGRLRQIGAAVSEPLEYVPARLMVIRHVRRKLAYVACETIFQAAAPSRPIARSVAGPALLANVLVSKYCDHIPLHRLARIHARDGVCFDPSTYGGWVEQSHALLDPRWPRSAVTRLAASKCTPTARRCRCSTPGAARRRPGNCETTCAMTGRLAAPSHPQPGTGTRPTARVSTRRPI